MGAGTLIDDWVESEPVAFDRTFLQLITRAPAERLRLVTGIGDSMYPTLNWGDAIMIDTTDRALARQDGIYWINLYGAAGIKRLRTVGAARILVKSDNPAVDDQEVDAEDLRIEGRAIWVARGL
jgi:phage repressor protein C with HTH and peptisase S24 domain